MKVLLTTLNSKFVHTNLAIRYLRNTLASLDCEVLMDEFTINQSTEVIVSELYDYQADIICFSTYIWNIDYQLEVAKMIKLVQPQTKILFGGPEVSYDAKTFMEAHPFIDFIIKGEGERTIKAFVEEAMSAAPAFEQVEGLVYREGQRVMENANRELIHDLDEIPFPYNDEELPDFKNKIIYYEASRGCPFNCAFCLSSTIKGVRFFSLDRVKKDLKKLLEANVKQIKFVDRTFNARKEYSLEIMKFIRANHNGMTNVHLEITAHLIDQEYIDFLRECPEGLFQFEIGVQSTHEVTIKSINRTTNFEKLSAVIQNIKGTKKVHQHLDLIAGLPYENYERFGLSFDDVYQLRPEKIQLGFLKLLKGSQLREEEAIHEYKYLDKPVYEVFENKYMSYSEFKKLKVIDHLVDVYYNEGRFDKTLQYLLADLNWRPFTFFEKFAAYWTEKDYHKCSLGLEKLYEVLWEASLEWYQSEQPIIKECLKYDYLRQQKNVKGQFLKLRDDLAFNQSKHSLLQNQDFIQAHLPQYKDLPAKKVYNFVTIESFKYDILKKEVNKLSQEEIEKIYLFSYNDNPLSFEKSEVIDVTHWMDDKVEEMINSR